MEVARGLLPDDLALVSYVALKDDQQAPSITEEAGALADVLSARWKQSEC